MHCSEECLSTDASHNCIMMPLYFKLMLHFLFALNLASPSAFQNLKPFQILHFQRREDSSRRGWSCSYSTGEELGSSPRSAMTFGMTFPFLYFLHLQFSKMNLWFWFILEMDFLPIHGAFLWPSEFFTPVLTGVCSTPQYNISGHEQSHVEWRLGTGLQKKENNK